VQTISLDPDREMIYGFTYPVFEFFEDLGAIVDGTTGENCFRVHDLVVVGDTLYLGETDNPERTNHLWEIELQ